MENIFNFTGIVDTLEQKRLICGRTNHIKELLDKVYAGHSVALIGERRIGKTAVLLLIRDIINGNVAEYSAALLDENLREALDKLKPENNWRAVYLDCEGLQDLPQQFFERIRAALAGCLDKKTSAERRKKQSSPKDFVAAIQELHNGLSEDDRVVILIDEVEALLEVESQKGPVIFPTLRSIVQSCPKICFIIAGAERWHQYIKSKTSAIARSLFSFYLKAPDSYPMEAFLIGFITNNLGNKERNEVEQAIAEWTGYKPYYVQAVCWAIAEIYQDGQPLPSNWKDTVEQKVVEQVGRSIKAFFESDNLDDTTRKILVSLAHTPGQSTPEIARNLGLSKESIWTRVSDLQALAKVFQEKTGYRIVGSLLERWGKNNEENPVRSPWPQRLRWGMAFILLMSCILVYIYTHPPLQTFSHAFADVDVAVHLPASLERDETGKANVRIQNITASSVYTVTVILASRDIDFREGESNRATLVSLHPGESRYWEPDFVAHSPVSGSTFSISVSVTQGPTQTVASQTFDVAYRPLPLRQYWLAINGILVAIGAFINKNDLMQLAINLWGVLKKTHSTAVE